MTAFLVAHDLDNVYRYRRPALQVGGNKMYQIRPFIEIPDHNGVFYAWQFQYSM
jgi:hypothetical protein